MLDFKDIPQANTGSGEQDTFELFARDFFQILGYEIIENPDRGADGKKDLIILEKRNGISGTTLIKWLVSCKHFAHSGKAVKDSDEINILDRVKTHDCDGFIGFFSTLPATSLSSNFKGLKKEIEIDCYDKKRIESVLLESPQGLKLASRYFIPSFSTYAIENPKPAKIFSNDSEIRCEYCNKNLLDDKSGIFVILREPTDWDSSPIKKFPYEKAYYSCKGKCDNILQNRNSNGKFLLDEWVDISDFLSPTTYIKKQIAWMNSMQIEKDEMTKEVFEKLKMLFINCFPYIAREQTTEEKEKVKFYLENGLMDFL